MLYIYIYIYNLYIYPLIESIFPSLIRDSPLELMDRWHKSEQKELQKFIQVDLLWDAFRLERSTIQHGPGFTCIYWVCNSKWIPYSTCHDCQRKSCELQGWERPNCLQGLPSWYHYSGCWQLACKVVGTRCFFRRWVDGIEVFICHFGHVFLGEGEPLQGFPPFGGGFGGGLGLQKALERWKKWRICQLFCLW